MPTPLRLSPPPAHDALAGVLARLPGSLGLSRDFPPDVLREAEAAAASTPLPDADRSDIPFVTVDPPGSTDLDQALHLERDGAGYRVHYAIAELPAFIAPGGALDREARERGQTVYAADHRIPLHPAVLSEGAASLLEGRLRGAYVWEFALDHDARVVGTSVAPARVRSRERLDYATGQARADAGDGLFTLLREVGEARLALESARGGASLAIPEVLVTREPGGRYALTRRRQLPVEKWNAQLSLMTGMAAAQLMLEARVGILRTMPPADDEAIRRFRHQTRALGHPWPPAVAYGDYLRDLDRGDPQQLAILHAASALFRGAGYTPFDGELPEETVQAAIAAPYAHVTAPLRRLVDRFGLAVCAALSAGADPPEWARAALPELPGIMARTSNVAGRLDRLTLDAVEAAVLSSRVGDTFDAVVLTAHDGGGTVQLAHPPVEGRCDGDLEPGTDVTVRLTTADVTSGTVRFARAGR